VVTGMEVRGEFTRGRDGGSFSLDDMTSASAAESGCVASRTGAESGRDQVQCSLSRAPAVNSPPSHGLRAAVCGGPGGIEYRSCSAWHRHYEVRDALGADYLLAPTLVAGPRLRYLGLPPGIEQDGPPALYRVV
jgi:hypothetical protein